MLLLLCFLAEDEHLLAWLCVVADSHMFLCALCVCVCVCVLQGGSET